MLNYGIIQNGQLLISDKQPEGYKLIVYADVPEFDESTQYVEQGDIVEHDDRIEVGVIIKDLQSQDEPVEEETEHEFVEYPPRHEIRKEDSSAERLTLLEDAILALMME